MNKTPKAVKAPGGLKKSNPKKNLATPSYTGRPNGRVGGGSLLDFAGRPASASHGHGLPPSPTSLHGDGLRGARTKVKGGA